MKILSWVIVVLGLFPSGFSFIDDFDQAYPIVEPDPAHTKLRLARAGLEAIERIAIPIAAVAVIGPYRSGKSFLLNQLLSLSCNEGFGVGHMRDTKTKGIWVWGTPIEVDINGVKTSIFYLDTEGFESIGKSNDICFGNCSEFRAYLQFARDGLFSWGLKNYTKKQALRHTESLNYFY